MKIGTLFASLSLTDFIAILPEILFTLKGERQELFGLDMCYEQYVDYIL